MESLGLYLLKSAVWLTGFTLVFLMVLRNERYFRLNRIYLLSGIVAAIAFPFYTWHYAVILPSVQVAFTTTSDFSAVATVVPVSTPIPFYWWLYLVGMISIALRLVWQTGMVVRKLRKIGYVKTGSVKLVRTAEYAASFSFFSFVFVNPSTSDIETKEIVNHEREHIQQRHWFDLLFVELLCMLQWFNPFVWIYARLIRQNHEYLADEMALQHTSNPAIYQATLLNQMLGAPVISLANSFSYSLNKKRFKMMKKKIDSPFRKLRMLLVLPLVAMVFYAFAKPEYITSAPVPSTEKIITVAEALNELKVTVDLPVVKSDKVIQVEKDKIVKGKVVNHDGKPLKGTSVILKGTTIGTITDNNGEFELKDVPKDRELVFSYVGLETAVIKPDFGKSMTVKMLTAAFGIDKVVVVGYGNPSGPPPPPPPPPVSADTNNALLIILDGVPIDQARADAINPNDIGSINDLKGEKAIAKYGQKAINGVIEIHSKGNFSGNKDDGSKLKEISFRSVGSQYAPLYLLDGEIADKARMDALKSNDIESISVLKDKSATALYGEKGKYGVIIITSKEKQAASSDTKTSKVYTVVEEMPEFPGGINASRQFIVKNIKYPVEAQKANAQGTVIVNFVVNSSGKVERAKVVRGVHPALDAEAIRVVNSMPDWKPGIQRGQAVDVVYTMPIEFMLQ